MEEAILPEILQILTNLTEKLTNLTEKHKFRPPPPTQIK